MHAAFALKVRTNVTFSVFARRGLTRIYFRENECRFFFFLFTAIQPYTVRRSCTMVSLVTADEYGRCANGIRLIISDYAPDVHSHPMNSNNNNCGHR